MSAEIIQGDSLRVMQAMQPEGVDAIVTDPPYCSGGQFRSEIARPTTEKYGGWSQAADGSTCKPKASAFYSAFSGDNKDGRVFLAWSREWMSEAFRVTRDGGYFAITTDWRQLPAVTDMMQFAGWTWRGLLVWDKKIGRPVRGRFRNHIEYVVWGSRGSFSGADVYASSLHSETPPNHRERTHTTEKTVGLMEFMMSVLPSGITVLDPFCGSGTTGVACINTGRHFIGVETEPAYAEIARRRIAEAQAQGDLLTGVA